MTRFTDADVKRIQKRRKGASEVGPERPTTHAAPKKVSTHVQGHPEVVYGGAFGLILPWPPTANTATRHTKTGQHYLTAEHVAYRERVAAEWLSPRRQMIRGHYSIEIWSYPPDRRRRDFDNIFKVLADALQKCGAIEDDCNMRQLTARIMEPTPPGRVQVWCWSLPG